MTHNLHFMIAYRMRTRLRAFATGTVVNKAATSRGQTRRHRTAVWNDPSPISNHYKHHHHNSNTYWYRERRRRHLAYNGRDRNQRPLATVSIRPQDACCCSTTREPTTTRLYLWHSLK